MPSLWPSCLCSREGDWSWKGKKGLQWMGHCEWCVPGTPSEKLLDGLMGCCRLSLGSGGLESKLGTKRRYWHVWKPGSPAALLLQACRFRALLSRGGSGRPCCWMWSLTTCALSFLGLPCSSCPQSKARRHQVNKKGPPTAASCPGWQRRDL